MQMKLGWTDILYNLHFKRTCCRCDINKLQIKSEDSGQKYLIKRAKNTQRTLIGRKLYAQTKWSFNLKELSQQLNNSDIVHNFHQLKSFLQFWSFTFYTFRRKYI